MLPEISAGTNSGFEYSLFTFFTEYNGSLYFPAGDTATGYELYKLTNPQQRAIRSL